MPAGKKTWYSRQTQLKLTVSGWLFLAMTGMLGLAAVQSQAAMVFVTFGIMLGALLVSIAMAGRMVSAVSVRRDMPDRVWQHQTVHLAYSLRNSHRSGACLGLNVDEISAGDIETAGGYCLELQPRSVFRAGARFAALSRGRINLRAVQVSTSFPFGLVMARRAIDAPRSLVVWPALGKLKRRLLMGGAVETSSAPPSGVSGGQDEFFGLREYRDGDNPRWIHWRRSAATTMPVIREMAKPLPEVLWVIVDTYWPNRLPEAGRRREQLLRFAATLIDHALSRGFMVGMAVACSDGARILHPAEGRGQRSSLLDALADVDENIDTPLTDVLAGLHRGQFSRGQVVVIAPDSPRLAGASLAAIRAEGKSLTIITERELPEIFQDNPLAVAEQDDAA